MRLEASRLKEHACEVTVADVGRKKTGWSRALQVGEEATRCCRSQWLMERHGTCRHGRVLSMARCMARWVRQWTSAGAPGCNEGGSDRVNWELQLSHENVGRKQAMYGERASRGNSLELGFSEGKLPT